MGTALKHLVLIEPQELFIPYLVTTLEAGGLYVIGAAGKMDEVEIALHRPDAILVDITLCDANNLAMLRGVRRACPRARLVAFGDNSPAWQANVRAERINVLLSEYDGPAELIEAAKGPKLVA